MANSHLTNYKCSSHICKVQKIFHLFFQGSVPLVALVKQMLLANRTGNVKSTIFTFFFPTENIGGAMLNFCTY